MSALSHQLNKFIKLGAWRDVIFSALVTPAGMGLMFIFFLLAGRKLPVNEFGEFSFVIQIASTGAVLLSMGLPVSAQKYIPFYKAREETETLHQYLTWSLVWMSFVVTSLVVVGVFLLLVVENSVPYLAALSMVPVSIWLWQRYTALGQGNVAQAMVPREIIVSTLVILLFALFDLQSAERALLIYNVVFVSVMIAASLFLIDRKTIDLSALRGNREKIVGWHKVAAPMSFTALTQLGFNGLDIILLGLLSTLYDAGLYSAALRIALLVAIIIRILNIALGQKFSAHFALEKFDAINSLYKKATMLSVLAGGVLFVVVAVFSEELLGLFGKEYTSGALVLVVLAAGQLSGCAVGPVGVLHNMIGNQKFAAKSQAIWLCLAISINVIVIPHHGALGAAVVTASSLWMMRIHQWLVLRQFLSARI